MARSTFSAILKQAGKYKKIGYGGVGSVLKHSLYPLKYLKSVLPSTGRILDLGCGEGMLANLLASELKGVEFHGVDLDKTKIENAKRVAQSNAAFTAGDINDLDFSNASAVIFNDVLHHNPDEGQIKLLGSANKFLDEDGLLVLKEVDSKDRLDVFWTNFWDKKLYPNDKLNFHNVEEWERILRKAGFRVIGTYRNRHFWPASRTIIIATKKPKLERIAPTDSKVQGPPRLNVLLTGASGFIGEHLAREILLNGIDGEKVSLSVIARDPGKLASDIRGFENVKIITEDLTDIGERSVIFDEYDYVFHLASRVAFFSGKEILEENVGPTRNLLKALPGKKLKRFIFTSTMGAFDRSKNDPCKTPLDESSCPHPVSFYGKSKLESEKVVKDSGLPYTIIRVPWCYGPGMSITHHVRVLFEKVMKGGILFKLNWPGRVSMIEVRDLSKILCEIALNPKAQDQEFFVSDGKPIRFGELFAEMGRMAGKRAGFINIPAVIWWFAKLLRVFAPFQLKSLYMDVLSVSNAKLTGIGQSIAERSPDFLLPLGRYINEQRSPSRFRSKVFITGAASGIGRALSKRFYFSGYSMLLLDKNQKELTDLARELRSEYKAVDLADQGSLNSLCGELPNKNIEIVVNNAGVGSRANFCSMDKKALENMIKVNCMAPVLINRALLPRFNEMKHGTVINIASSSAFQPLPYMAVYSASKAFMMNFSEAISAESMCGKDSGVEIITISPSGTATNFQVSSGVKKLEGEKLLSPDRVAAEIVAAIGKGSRSVIIGTRGKVMSLISRILPKKLQLKLWSKLMSQMR